MVGVIISIYRDANTAIEIAELSELCKSVGIEIHDHMTQKLIKTDPKHYLGSGKIQEVKDLLIFTKSEIVVVNDRISSTQKKNLEKLLCVQIMDRNEVILQIFRKNACSAESKCQVELASLQYELPKLIGKNDNLSRTGGGIGTVGPGETELEYNRRTIQKRISILKSKLKEIEAEHQRNRKNRLESSLPIISIVGYTSAGKSTLLKNISGDESILVSPDLFSTLSPSVRRIRFACGLAAVVSDTVGFVNRLPLELIESFKSTLQEVKDSDIIVKVIDLSSTCTAMHIRTIDSILGELNAQEIPQIIIFNKVDVSEQSKISDYKLLYPKALFTSVADPLNKGGILQFIQDNLVEKGIIKNNSVEVLSSEEWKFSKFIGNIGICEKKNIEEKVFFKMLSKESQYKKIIKSLEV
ncbi:MAG: GTPase HflX [Petrotogaceae bacterium]|nr:GTPase HflX [Petrotogaceae bacterium]